MRILDTCFLIDLHREWLGGRPGPASRYLQDHAGDEFALSVISSLEFLEGYRVASDGERFLSPFPQISVTPRVARTGGRIRRTLRGRGEMIGDFDILIAATAIENEMILVTENTRHFARIEGLVLEGYK